MSLWKWLKSVVTGRPPERDVSRLEPRGEDAVDESVDVSGGPLKPGHRRRALRDRRLLPKARAPVGKRPRVFSRQEAQRLFSSTMLTRNRGLRDLLTDEEQLARLHLPVWKSEEEVARALGITLRQLWFFAIHREKERAPHYVTFAIPKRSGGERLIMAPKRRLKALLRRLDQLLVKRLPLSPQAHGFRPGRSIRTAAAEHVGKRVVLRMDLADFFPSVSWARVRGLLIAYGYSFPVATALAVMMTEAERQPVEFEGELYHVPVGERHCVQGAPTSPGLCNAVALRLDRRLHGLARRYGFAYTRYADDLSFSGEDRAAAHALMCGARRLIEAEGFRVNEKKTRIMGCGRRQTVAGVVVNQVLGRSRQERRRLRAALHRAGLSGASSGSRGAGASDAAAGTTGAGEGPSEAAAGASGAGEGPSEAAAGASGAGEGPSEAAAGASGPGGGSGAPSGAGGVDASGVHEGPPILADARERARLRGKLAFLWMLNPEQASALWPGCWTRPTLDTPEPPPGPPPA